MATREENLKKINEELEKLDDVELDKVAGGACDWRSPKHRNVIDDGNPKADTDSNQPAIHMFPAIVT